MDAPASWRQNYQCDRCSTMFLAAGKWTIRLGYGHVSEISLKFLHVLVAAGFSLR
jgi:hypothetical protein